MSNTEVKRTKKVWKRRRNPLGIIALIAVAIIFIFPFLWALGISLLKESRFVYDYTKFLKPPFAWENYIIVFKEANFIRYTWNTLVIVGLGLIGTLLSNSFIAFGFARYQTKGLNTLFMLGLCTMFLPGTVMAIPMYVIWNKLGFIDTYVPLILPSYFGAIMSVFFIRQAFMSLPGALYEAALIDGAHPLRIYATIYVPLAKPILATLALRGFMGGWSDLFNPLIYINSPEKNTISLGLRYVSQKYADMGNIVMAAAIIAIVPVLVLYAFVQKTFVEGMASAAIKG